MDLCHAAPSRMHSVRNRMSHRAHIAANRRLSRARDRARLRELLMAAACVDCGTRDLAVLELDHREPRCANCYRRRTARQFGWRALLGLGNQSMYLLTWLRQYACAACGESGAVILALEGAHDTSPVLCANCHRRQARRGQPAVEAPSVRRQRVQPESIRRKPAGVSLHVWIAKTC